MNNKTAQCPSCGIVGVDSVEACQAIFAQVIGREFADSAFFAAHRLTVDAYSLQHPEQYMESSKSAAAHLTGMCWSMEYGPSLHLPEALKSWVDGTREFTRLAPPLPLSRGVLNLGHVADIADPERYLMAVTEWAQSAWNAWSAHWPQARKWISEAIADSSR